MAKIYNIIELIGDGISQEITNESIKLLKVIESFSEYKFNIERLPIGYTCYKKYGSPITSDIISKCILADGVLLGAVGDPDADNLPSHLRPEMGLLKLREGMRLYCNIRPVKVCNKLISSSPLKREIIENVDIVFVRELSSGIYKSVCGKLEEEYAEDIMKYNKYEIERILNYAFKLAMKRKKKLCIVDKANVLNCSRLWRKISAKISTNYPKVNVEYQYIDAMSYLLIKEPKKFDVIVTSNLFGDILSDEAAIFSSSLGMLPSMSLNEDNNGLYEPIHGSAPSLKNKNLANPIGTILSLSMMLFNLNMTEYSAYIEKSVMNVINNGFYTSDMNVGKLKYEVCGTKEFCEEVCNELAKILSKMRFVNG